MRLVLLDVFRSIPDHDTAELRAKRGSFVAVAALVTLLLEGSLCESS